MGTPRIVSTIKMKFRKLYLKNKSPPFNKCLLRTFYIPGTVLGSGDIAMNRTDQVPVFLVLLQLLGKTGYKYYNGGRGGRWVRLGWGGGMGRKGRQL